MKTKFRLYKRDDNGRELAPSAAGYKERDYYFRFTHKGKAYPRCLETNNAITAQARAKAKYAEIVAAVTTGEYRRLDATKLRATTSASLGDLVAAYRTGPSEAGIKTREVNINALLAMFENRDSALAQPVREINPALVRRHFERCTTKVLAATDQEAAASLKRSANSRWAQAKSLFTDRCLEHYLSLELITDPGRTALQAFLRAGELARFNRIPKVFYNPPREDIIAKTLDAWAAVTDRNLYLAIGHELAFGLRIGELAQACWNWHSERAGYPVLDGRATVKNGTGLIQIRALDPYYSIMKRTAADRGWWPADIGSNATLVITGNDTYRKDGLFRAVSDWLRHLGWETMKTNHALRAYAGSQIAMKYGIYEAQMWLRHSTVKVTEQNYSHFIQKFKPADLGTIPARWAALPAPAAVPTPKVSSGDSDVTLDATPNLRKTPSDSATVLPWKLETRN